jgi:tryptophan synthase alpha subunit
VKLLAPVSDGLIVGSAIVRSLDQAAADESKALDSMSQLVTLLISALEN